MKLKYNKAYLSIILLLISICGSILFQKQITMAVHHLMGTEKVTIFPQKTESSNNAPIRITGIDSIGSSVDFEYVYSFEELKNAVVYMDDFAIKKDTGGQEFFESMSPEAKIVFELPFVPESILLFQENAQGSGFISETVWGTEYVPHYDTEDGYVIWYPFHSHPYMKMYLFYIFIYGVVIAAICLFFILLSKICVFLYDNSNLIYSNRLQIIFIFLITFIFLMTYYLLNKEYWVNKPSEGSDAYYYANIPLYDETGTFSWSYMWSHTYRHRGCYFGLFIYICKQAASLSGIDYFYFYYFIISVLCAWAFGDMLPRIYNILFNRYPNSLSVFGTYIIFLLFWRQFVMMPMADVPACLFGIIAGGFMLCACRNRKIKYLFGAGICSSIALNIRTSYSFLRTIFVLYFVFLILQTIITHFKADDNKKSLITAIWFNCKPLLIYLLVFYTTAIPYLLISIQGGDMDWFPYNTLWIHDWVNNEVQTLTESSFQMGVQAYFLKSPKGVDLQMNTFYTNVFYNKLVTIREIIFLCMNQPLTFFTLWVKKIFVAFSISSQFYQIKPISLLEQKITLFLNYFMQISALLVCLEKKKKRPLNKKACWLGISLITLFGIFPALLHLEWRYFLFPFLVIVFVFWYIVMPFLIENRHYLLFERKTIFYVIITISYLIVCYSFFETFQMNFL